MTNTHNDHLAALIERSSLGTREGRLRRSTVPASTGRVIARAAITGRYVTAATSTRQIPTTNTSQKPSTKESRWDPKGRDRSADL